MILYTNIIRKKNSSILKLYNERKEREREIINQKRKRVKIGGIEIE